MKKSIKRAIAVMAMALIFILIVGTAGISLFLKSDRGRLLAHSMISEAITGSVHWSHGRYALWRGEVELRGVVLRNAGDHEIAGFDRLFLIISLPDLLRGNLTLEWLAVENPWAELQQDEEGALNILQALAPTGKSPQESGTGIVFPRNVILKEGHLIGGSCNFTSLPDNYRLNAKAISLKVQGNLLEERATVRASLGGLSFVDQRTRHSFRDIIIEGAYRRGSLNKLHLSAAAEESTLSLRGSIQNVLNDPDMDIALDASLSLAELEQWARLDHPLGGILKARGHVKGKPGNPEIDLSISQRGAVAENLPLDFINASMHLRDRDIHLDKAIFGTTEIKARLSGFISLKEVFPAGFAATEDPAWDALSYNMVLNQDKSCLEHLHTGLADLEGALVSTIRLQGTGITSGSITAEASVSATLEGLRTDREEEPLTATLQSNLSLKGGTARVESLHVASGEAFLALSGSVHAATEKVEGALELQIPRLNDLARSFGYDVEGAINLEAILGGTFAMPLASLSGKARSILYNQLRIGDIDYAAHFDESGLITIDHVTVGRDSSSLLAGGTLSIFDDEGFRLKENPSFTIHLRGDPVRLEDFTDALRGTFVITGNMKGTFNNPWGTLTVEGRGIETDYQNFDRLTLRITADDSGITIDSFQALAATGETIDGSGWIGMDRSFVASIYSREISPASLDAAADLREMVEGTFSFDIKGSGNLANPVFTGSLHLKDLIIKGEQHRDMEGEIRVADGIIRLRVRSDLSLEADYDIESGDYNLTAHGDAVSLDPYVAMAGISGITGHLTARLTASGNAADLSASTGRIELRNISLGSDLFGSIEMEDVTVTLAGKTLTLDRSILRLPQDQFLVLAGTFTLDGLLDCAVDGDIPLSLAGIFIEDADDFTGSAHFSGRVRGTLAEPDMHADLVIREGGFKVYSLLSPRLHGINGAVRFKNSTVTIEHLAGFMESGTFYLDGTVVLGDLRPALLDITFRGNGLPFDLPDTMHGRLDTFLTFRGNDSRFDLDGEITILDALYYRDLRLRHISEAISAAALPAPPSAPEASGSLLDKVNMNITVRHRTPMAVHNNIADLKLVPDLRVMGTLAHPVVSGRLAVQSGTVTYQRREFVVTRGVVDFLNPYRTEATLDIESRVTIRQWLITLKITGPTDQLVFSLTSNPPEEQGNVLSLLLTGRTTNELTGQPGDVHETAAGMVAAIINATMADDVRRTTGLDIFEVEVTGDDADLFSDRFRVTLGRELSRRLAVKYSFQTEQGELVQRMSTEYKLLENILANAFQDNRGNFGGGIRFRLEFY